MLFFFAWFHTRVTFCLYLVVPVQVCNKKTPLWWIQERSLGGRIPEVTFWYLYFTIVFSGFILPLLYTKRLFSFYNSFLEDYLRMCSVCTYVFSRPSRMALCTALWITSAFFVSSCPTRIPFTISFASHAVSAVTSMMAGIVTTTLYFFVAAPFIFLISCFYFSYNSSILALQQLTISFFRRYKIAKINALSIFIILYWRLNAK